MLKYDLNAFNVAKSYGDIFNKFEHVKRNSHSFTTSFHTRAGHII